MEKPRRTNTWTSISTLKKGKKLHWVTKVRNLIKLVSDTVFNETYCRAYMLKALSKSLTFLASKIQSYCSVIVIHISFLASPAKVCKNLWVHLNPGVSFWLVTIANISSTHILVYYDLYDQVYIVLVLLKKFKNLTWTILFEVTLAYGV